MSTLAKRNQKLLRMSAAFVAFVYAYFGFVAALHHTDGFVPVGQSLAFSALDCRHTHPVISTDAGATECGVCEFQASLTSPALALFALDCPAPAPSPQPASTESLYANQPSTLHAPRAPPAA